MSVTPTELLAVTLVVTFVVALGVAVYSRLLSWHRSRSPRLRLLTGTRSQHAAIVLAVRPVVRELLPGLEASRCPSGIQATSSPTSGYSRPRGRWCQPGPRRVPDRHSVDLPDTAWMRGYQPAQRPRVCWARGELRLPPSSDYMG